MKSKYLIDVSSGRVYTPVEDPIITDLPESTEIKYFTCIYTGEDMRVLCPGTKVVDVSSLHITGDTNPLYGSISFDTDLPVVYDYDGKTYLLLGNPPDSSYDLMDTYVYIMNKDGGYIPYGEKYLCIETMIVGDYDTENLPYRKFCRERGIKYISHFSHNERIRSIVDNPYENVDLTTME